MAGQGLNLGLADSQSLGNHLLRGLYSGGDVGAIPVLQGYASERYFPNLAMLGATDKLNRLFRATDPIIPAIRSFGFTLLDKVIPIGVKQTIVKLATKGW